MPRASHIEKDLVRINVTAKAHAQIMKRKSKGEPIYRVVDRIVTSYLDNDANEWQEMYYEQVETTKSWIKKYNELKEFVDKNLGRQATLIDVK